MTASELRQLRQLAQLQGIQLAYTTAAGQRRSASPEVLLSVLHALGLAIETVSDIPAALHQVRTQRDRQWLEPVTVAWAGTTTRVNLRLPPQVAHRRAHAQLILEDGQRHALQIPNTPAGQSQSAGYNTSLRLPRLPPGYHELELETAQGRVRSLIVCAPLFSYTDPSLSREWGVFLPLYAAHSRHSWGAGNFSDWQRLSEWVASLGGTVMGTLPLLATFLDQPTCAPSPYSPASRLFWNEFYIDVEATPEFASSHPAQRLVQSAPFQRQLRQFRGSRLINYAAQMAARRAVLEQMTVSFFQGSARLPQFHHFLGERPEVEHYACFRAVCDRTKQPWPAWPARQRRGHLRPGDYLEAAKKYHLYVQWVAHEQMATLANRTAQLGARLYLDLPLGVHPDGYDTWRHQTLFAAGANVGAPPDPFFSKGQDWGFAPLHPQRLREERYQYLLQYLRFQMQHTRLLRIDHVMGLHRLYWVPRGLAPTEGAYVLYPSEELYALLCLESHRSRTMLVGENLGTVPPEVNASMQRHRLRRMFVVPFEQRPEPRRALSSPPAQCVASLNTHDMPTFAAYWTGADIADRADLGLFRPGEASRERRERRRLKSALVSFFKRKGLLKGDTKESILSACLQWLGASSAEIVLLNLEDLWFETASQNTPGTFKERPNWQRKAALPIEDLNSMPALLLKLERMVAARARRS